MRTRLSSSIALIALLANLSPVTADPVPAILYVAPGGNCLGRTPCYGHPQDAVDAAPAGSVIRIATGTYALPAGASQVVYLTKSLILQGGYRPTEWFSADPFAFPTVLDGQHLGQVMRIAGDSGQPIQVVVDGLQITKGMAIQGGGVAGSAVQLSLRNTVLSDNQATGSGGGLYLSGDSGLTLEYSRVISNTAGDVGGGLALHSSSGQSQLTRSWISGNHALNGGGGLSLVGGQAQLTTVMLVDNVVTQPGANGSGAAASGASLNLAYATVARNTGGAGTGVSLSGTSTLTATNLLAAGQVVAVSASAPSSGTVDGVLWGAGSIWANGANTAGSGSLAVQHAYSGDPLFVALDPANRLTYFHLSAASPARDRSVSAVASYTDIDNESVVNAIADLGADEYSVGGSIHVNVEAGGDIEIGSPDGNPENNHGALFWNASQWVTHGTSAHMYYTDLRTTERLKHYAMIADIDDSAAPELDVANYHLSRTTYTYTVPAQAGGIYRIEASRYRLTANDSPETIWLNSRGTGTGQAYFDIFVQSAVTATLAIRDGSAWFTYSEPIALAAQHDLQDPAGRAGTLTTCDLQDIDRSRYWLDLNGGSDMGGLTYFIHTSHFSHGVVSLGPCFPDEFRVKYLQSATKALEEFRLRPDVVSEIWLPATLYLPFIRR